MRLCTVPLQRLAALLWLLLLPLGLAAGPASAISIDESTFGDLSDDPANPTPLDFEVGDNIITGSVTSGPGADTQDFLTFTIEPGEALTALLLLQYEDLDVGGPANRGFHGINAGAASFPPGTGTYLGSNHLDFEPPGTDLLPVLATMPISGTGFTVPLGPGTYSYVIQQTGPQLNGYSVNFVVTPEPTTGLLLLSGLGLLAVRRRR